jgi:Meiotically up-regulated gene 113
MDKSFILSEVRRTAMANGGVALGRLRLETETGIKDHHWGKFWARYGELVREAGFEPNAKTEAWTEAELCAYLAGLIRELGKFPTHGEVRVKNTTDPDFPNHRVFDQRLGGKADRVAKVIAFCRANPGYDDVFTMCENVVVDVSEEPVGKPTRSNDGHVYLLKSGKFYKIGFSVDAGVRERQLAIQLPEAASTVHVIVTDDPPGIEAYWHRRFTEQRKNGEWFALTREDVAAFKRRKFM